MGLICIPDLITIGDGEVKILLSRVLDFYGMTELLFTTALVNTSTATMSRAYVLHAC
jgi:hypothetical protein